LDCFHDEDMMSSGHLLSLLFAFLAAYLASRFIWEITFSIQPVSISTKQEVRRPCGCIAFVLIHHIKY
jgi:hypothetical protein